MSKSSIKTEVPPASHDAASRKIGKVPILVLVLVVAAGVFWFIKSSQPDPSSGRLMVSGRIEGYETDIGAKIGGKVESIEFREGALVKKGALVANLEDDDIQAQLRSAKASTQASISLLNEKKEALNIVQSQIEQARLELSRSKEGVTARIEQTDANKAQAQAMLAQAQAKLTEAKASLELARKRKERYEKLLKPGAVTRDEYDEALRNFDTAEATVNSQKAFLAASKKEVTASGALYDQARADRFSPDIRGKDLNVIKMQLIQAEHQLESAVHQVEASKSREEEVQAKVSYLRLTSPINGVVTARPVEPGTVVGAGTRIITVVDLDNVYMRAYIPESEIGKVRVGDTAEVVLDSFPDKPLKGEIIEIDSVASFTPQNIYFKDDRVKQVFGIKIGIKNSDRFAKPGMPADAYIDTSAPGGK